MHQQRRRVPAATVALVAALVVGMLALPLSGVSLRAIVGPGFGATGATGATTAASANWPDDAVVYHVFVDRFADGDDATGTTQVAGTPDDPAYADLLTDWMGGDLAGVRARLDHIVASGANTIWLSPVTPGPFFHGYHPTDLTDVDPRFGDVDELRALVADAEARGLKVLYDLVLNHTSDQHPWFRAAQADCEGSEFVAYYRFRACPTLYDGFAGLSELPQLQPDHPPLQAYLFDEVLPFWLDDIGVHGFRLDHVEGPSRDFWRALDAELDARWPGTLLLGEVWAQQTIIDSYGDVLDAATAFPFRDRLLTVFARGGNVPATSLLVGNWVDDAGLPRDDIPLASTYLSSHDQSRFTFQAGGDTARTALAYQTILTLPGLPVIYYGDEVGLSQTDALPDGAPFQDRWYREPMPWDEAAWDTELWSAVAAVARLRTETPALHNDATYTEHLSEGSVWVFSRTPVGNAVAEPVVAGAGAGAEPVVIVVLNAGTEVAAVDLGEVLGPQLAPPGARFRDLLDPSSEPVAGPAALPPLTLRVLAPAE